MSKQNGKPTTWRKLFELHFSSDGKETYAYYCTLCEEILALTKRKIDPRKIKLIFNDECPGCDFQLEKVLRCEILKLKSKVELVMHPKIEDPRRLLKASGNSGEFKISKADMLRADVNSDLTSGMSALDSALGLRLGQLVALHGKEVHSLSSLFCVRATLPRPLGLDSDTIFLDGGNIFDAYAIAEHSLRHEIEAEKTLARIHLSRAFTYHQLSTLINEKLAHAIHIFNAKLVAVSDIAMLYCDPDIKIKAEALDVFRRDLRALSTLAEQKRILIIVTNLQTRNRRMDAALLQTAHVSATLEDRDTFIQLTLSRHPFTPQLKAIISLDKEMLESYL